MSTIGKIVVSALMILSTALAITMTATFADAPGGAYIQCNDSNHRRSDVHLIAGDRTQLDQFMVSA